MRVGGTAIFLTPNGTVAPHAFANNLRHNRVMHERVEVKPLCSGCHYVVVIYGFKDEVDLPRTLAAYKSADLVFDLDETSWFLSRALVVPKRGHGMALWRARLFAVMLHNVGNIAAFFNLPANRVIEVGARVEI